MWPVSGESLHRTVIVGAKGINLFDLRSEYTYRYEIQKQYGIFKIFPLLCTPNDYNSFSACLTIKFFGSLV